MSYVHDLENDRYVFQLTGGEEYPVTQEEFIDHWQEYRLFEEKRATSSLERYQPLPITFVTRRSVRLLPSSPNLRRKRKSA
ncbi:hypothetical protein ACHOLT_07400 [Desulfitobacterium sp. Sab5]|uniref:hypothetical protein n=1 Tax=Desulfitobacterium nosdiversum TaxID=3375356 RepID=UPI003CF842F4